MSGDVASAKQRHREAVFARYGVRPQCELRHRHRCAGRLEADHVIEVRWLKDAKGYVDVAATRPHAHPAMRLHPLARVTLDALVADGRNGWILCEFANQLKFRRMIPIERAALPPSVEDFATEFQIEHLLDRYFGGQR